MNAIYKYELQMTSVQHLELPLACRILKMDVQHQRPFLWCWVDTEVATETRRFVLVGTGHEIDNPLELTYIDSIQVMDGALVWHLFEVEDHSDGPNT